MRLFFFLSIVVLTLGGGGWYVYNRLSAAFSGTFVQSKVFIAFYIFVLFSFLIGKTLEYNKMYAISEPMLKYGSYMLGFMFYGFLAVIMIDLIRLANYFIPIFPAFVRENMVQTRFYTGLSVVGVVVFLVIYGIWNASQLRVKELDLTVRKEVPGLDSLHIVAVSDIHLGNVTGHKKLGKLIQKINEVGPDLVLIAGDMVDDNIAYVKNHRLLEPFKKLNPRFGVHAVMGNHEYIGMAHTDLSYFKENNIRLLIDSTELINDQFYIVGRDDIHGIRMTGKERKPLTSITKNADFSKPVLMLDHQPYALEEAQNAGIDLQISGHTHHGQMWPLSFITKMLFEQDWGYLLKGNTHYYISSGFGTAGPPVRVGSHSELVDIKLRFKPIP